MKASFKLNGLLYLSITFTHKVSLKRAARCPKWKRVHPLGIMNAIILTISPRCDPNIPKPQRAKLKRCDYLKVCYSDHTKTPDFNPPLCVAFQKRCERCCL